MLPLSARVEDAFLPLLLAFGTEAAENEPASVYGMWGDTAIAYVNPAYVQFAEDEGAPALGATWVLRGRVLDAVPPPLEAFYARLFERALGSSNPITHRYQCHSPRLAREFDLCLYSLGGRALLAVNSLVVSRPHEAPTSPDDARYRRANGVVIQCCHCRRVSRAAETQAWDLVPEYVDKPPPRTSHGLCAICFAYHYRND